MGEEKRLLERWKGRHLEYDFGSAFAIVLHVYAVTHRRTAKRVSLLASERYRGSLVVDGFVSCTSTTQLSGQCDQQQCTLKRYHKKYTRLSTSLGSVLIP